MLSAIGLAIMLFGHLSLPGLFLVFTSARRSVRIASAGKSVRLDACDPVLMAGFGGVSCIALPFALFLCNTSLALSICASALLLLFGFRVRIRVSAGAVQMRRMFAFVIPWRARSYWRRPVAFTDGWGDELDPQALWLDFGDEPSRIELAWGDSTSHGRNDELAAEFNNAVRALGDWPAPPEKPPQVGRLSRLVASMQR